MSLMQSNYQEKLEKVLSTGKKRSYFIAAITVFFILLMSIAGIIPALSSLGVQHEQNGKRDIIIGKLSTKLSILKDFVREESAKKSTIAFLNYLLPDNFPEKDSLNKIVALEAKNNIVIQNYTFAQAPPGFQEVVNTYTSINTKVLSLNFSGAGSLSDIQSFVKEIEDSRRIFDINSITISRLSGDALVAAGAKDYTVAMAINFYYYNPNAVAEAEAEAAAAQQ